MLLLNQGLFLVLHTSHHLNTSYVTVKPVLPATISKSNIHLNTSYVTVKQCYLLLNSSQRHHLNTSYVTVKLNLLHI